MDKWVGKIALVTGASAGIGAQIVRALAKSGMKVIATARRLDKLLELAASIKHEFKVDIYPLQCDVQKEEDILRVFKWANEKLGGIDVLINNVGVVYNEMIIEGTTANYHSIMNVNVIAAAICSRELVKSVKRRHMPGHIVNINSIAGHYAELLNIRMNLYAASKYAITGMAASLRNEMENSNLDVKVTNISPGAVETEMTPEKNVPLLAAKDIADTVVCVLSMPHHVQICEVIVVPHEPSSNNSRWYTQRPTS